MHISEGMLPTELLIGGIAASLLIVALCARNLDTDEIPKLSVISSVFFVADLIHVPFGPTSVHLMLTGLAGIILGPRAYLAVFLGVVMQAFLLGHGGIFVIGINSLMLGGGALTAYAIWSLRQYTPALPHKEFIFGALAGAASIFTSGIIMASALLFARQEFFANAAMVLFAHLIIMALEAVVVGSCANFLFKVKPELLAGFKPLVPAEKIRARA